MCTSKSCRKKTELLKNWVEMGELHRSKEERCIWYSGESDEIVSKGDGWERLQGFPGKGGDGKIACKGSEEEEMQREKSLVCTTNLALGSKKPVPFNRACMFTKGLGPSIIFYVNMPVT